MKTNSVNTDTRRRAKLYRVLSSFFRYKEGVILLLFLLLMAAGTFANKPKDRTPGGKGQQDNLNWKLDATVNGVSFYHAISDCGGNKVVFLKLVNKNRYTVNVSWKEAVKTQLRTEESVFRGEQKLSLPPGETAANNCSGSACKACILLTDEVNPTYPAQIHSFSFKDISVVK